jgi:septum formation protein
MPDPHLLLASNSPRRRQMLAWLDLPFSAQAMDVDESRLVGESPSQYVLRVAQAKALAAHAAAAEQAILAADTTVADGEQTLGKPADAAEARAMLRQLRGRSHQVHTGLVLVLPSGSRFSDLCVSQVPMRSYTDAEIESYIESGDPLDKAGAYAIQHPGFHPVETFSGCFASVMGLPLCHLVRTMRQAGFTLSVDPAQVCQTNNRYACPIHQRVLRGETVG